MSQKIPRHIPVIVEDFGVAEWALPPHIINIADFVNANLGVCPHVVSVLKDITARYPSLSFGDFVIAMRLVELATRETGGNA